MIVEMFPFTLEEKEASKRVVPVYAIHHLLTPEQKQSINSKDEIQYCLLNPEQKELVDEALAFDHHFQKVGAKVSQEVHKYI